MYDLVIEGGTIFDGKQFWVVDDDLQLGPVGYCVVRADGSKALGTTTLSESYWDPLWREAQERGLPINFHIGGGAGIGNLWVGMDEPTAIAAMSSLADITNMRCLINLIFSGLLDRYPRLPLSLGARPGAARWVDCLRAHNARYSMKQQPRFTNFPYD